VQREGLRGLLIGFYAKDAGGGAWLEVTVAESVSCSGRDQAEILQPEGERLY
jgi:hypothetical protein